MEFVFPDFLLTFFWLEPKEPKVQEKTNGSARFSGPTHKDFNSLKVVCLFEVEGRGLHCMLNEATGGADFSLALFIEECDLQQAKKRRLKYSLFGQVALLFNYFMIV